MLVSIITFIKGVAAKSWGVIFKTLVVAVFSLLFWKIYNGSIVLYRPNDVITFNNDQRKRANMSIKKLLKGKHVELVSILIYQPDGVPKHHVEVMFAESQDMTREEILDLPFVEEIRDLHENTEFYNTLQYKHSFIVKDDHRSYAGRFIKQSPDIDHLVIYGLYKYGSPYGSVVIAHDEPFDINCDYSAEFNEIAVIQSILFKN